MDDAPVAPTRLAVIDVLDRDGGARLSLPVWQWPVTIGRSVDCNVVLDNPHVAGRHATLREDDGVLSVQVGDSLNGVQLKGRRLGAQERADLLPQDVLQLGATRLRVRRASDLLAPERLLTPEPPRSRVPLLGLMLAVAGWQAASHWLVTDPGERLTDYLPALLGLPLALAVWSGFWAAGSRLVRHQFDFGAHARIAFGYSLIAGIVTLLLPLAAFSLGWPLLSRITGIAAMAVLWAMVLAHLSRMLPARRRLLAAVMGTIFLAGVSLFLTRSYQLRDRLFPELYVATLAPPVVRVAPAVATTRFIDEARALKSTLDAHIKDEDAEGDGPASMFDSATR